MPVFIFEPDALQKMAAVEGEKEGPEWIESQRDGRMGDQATFSAFHEFYMREFVPCRDEMIREGRGGWQVHPRGSTMMYGWWGWNRYILLASGEIVFLEGFARSDECAERARQGGFTVRP